MSLRWEAGGGDLLMSDTLYLHSTAVSNVSCSPVNLPREPTLAASSLEEPRAFGAFFFCFFLIHAQGVVSNMATLTVVAPYDNIAFLVVEMLHFRFVK